MSGESTDRSADYDLHAFIPRITPKFGSPRHLSPLVGVLHRAFRAAAGLGPPVFACVSEPPQHGKSQTILHGLAHHLELRPQDMLGYISYGDQFAQQQSRFARDYARHADVQIRQDSFSVSTWLTTAGGGVIARGIGGAITGQAGLKVIVVDDPFRNREDAESRVIRDKVYAEWQSTIATRLHPTTSVIINHTRWHMDDLIGRLLKHEPDKWEHINMPAINAQGEALWPEGQPLDHLLSLKRTVSDYAWWSLYMGEPRPRDTQLFQGVSFYSKLPNRLRYAIGVDLAYTSKTVSDWSVAVVMAADSTQYYVVDVIRRQCSAPDFADDLKALGKRYPGAPMLWYGSGTERGVCDFFQREGVRLGFEPATSDKFNRATPLSAAWNRGDVHVREGAPWVPEFTQCLLDFTGVNDPHDDDVDAAAAAFDQLNMSGSDVLPVVSRESIRQQVRDYQRGRSPMGGARSHRHGTTRRR